MDGEIFRNDNVSIGATSTEVSRDMNSAYIRADLSIVNYSATACTLGIGTEAVANKGIYLAAGSVVSWSMSEGYPPLNGRITAVGNGATLAVFERLIPRRY